MNSISGDKLTYAVNKGQRKSALSQRKSASDENRLTPRSIQRLVKKYAKLAGITNVQADNGSMHFFFKGDINTILKKLNELKVVDVTIEEPTLEEIFMHYYE